MNAVKLHPAIPQFLLLIWIKRQMPCGKRHPRDVFFVIFTLCTLAFLLVLTPLMLWLELNACAIASIIAWCLVALSLWLWRHTRHMLLPVLVFELTLLGLILFTTALLGGVVSPTLIWLGIVPLLPFFLTRRVWCYAFLVLSFAMLSILFVLQLQGYVASPPGTAIAQLWSGMLMNSLFVLAQVILVAMVDAHNLLRLRKARHNNNRLRALTHALNQANAHKDRFLFSVSHEIRTPLNAVYGFLEQLRQRKDLPESATEQIGHAATSATHLLTIINDLLDYAQIRQGRFSLAMQPVDLPLLLQEIHQILQGQAERKHLHYVWKAISPVPRWVRVDPHRLTQILLNLLGNAIKFTPEGEVRLEVSYRSEGEDGGDVLELEVIDSGIGIPADQLEHIFQPFVQLAAGNRPLGNSALRGNGLGLAITHSLILAWGGQISVHRRPEGGTVFKVCLPIQTAEPKRDALPDGQRVDSIDPTWRSRAYKLLLVDDHAMNRMVARAAIQQALPASHIDEAQNGEQALEKMAAHDYDLVLMDIVMHDINGIDVVRIARDTFPKPFCDVQVIALTANLADDIARQCAACDIAAIVPKPFKASVLIQAIAQHARRPAAHTQANHNSAEDGG